MRPLPDSRATFTFDIDPEAGLALAHMTGELDGDEMLAIAQAVHGDPRWEPHFDAIWDCRAVRSHAVTPSQVRPLVDETLAQNEAADGQAGQDVMVEAGGIVDLAISHLIAVLCRRAGKEVRVVGTMAGALETLGRDSLPATLAAVADPAA